MRSSIMDKMLQICSRCPTAVSLLLVLPSMALSKFTQSFFKFELSEAMINKMPMRMWKPTGVALSPPMALPNFAMGFSAGVALRPSIASPKFARSFSKLEITDEMMNTMPIQMWLDINTIVPSEGGMKSIIEMMTKGLRRLGFQGPVNVEAFGDTESLCAETRKELGDAVDVVIHVPAGEDISKQEVTMDRVGKFCRENPPPALHYFISSSAGLTSLKKALRELGYTAMHAVPPLSSTKFEITEEMQNTMPIWMWWDLDDYVSGSVGVSSFIMELANNLPQMGFNGPVSMVAYGDTQSLPAETRRAIAAAMTLIHVPSGTVLDVMSGDMLKWAEENSPPACFFLVSSNGPFIHTLNKLKLQGYAILAAMATPQ